jgi:hypothetical protein
MVLVGVLDMTRQLEPAQLNLLNVRAVESEGGPHLVTVTNLTVGENLNVIVAVDDSSNQVRLVSVEPALQRGGFVLPRELLIPEVRLRKLNVLSRDDMLLLLDVATHDSADEDGDEEDCHQGEERQLRDADQRREEDEQSRSGDTAAEPDEERLREGDDGVLLREKVDGDYFQSSS